MVFLLSLVPDKGTIAVSFGDQEVGSMRVILN